MSSNWGCILSRQLVLHTMQCRSASIRLHLGPQTLPTPLRRGTPRFSVFEMVPRNVGSWQCAPKARITSGGGFHPDSCRLIRELTSGSAGQPEGLEPRDKGGLGRLSDPAGRNASEA